MGSGYDPDAIINAEWAAKDAHYDANPVSTPVAQDGTVLTLGQRVRHTCSYCPQGAPITDLKVRCYGNPSEDPVYDYSAGIGFKERVQTGTRPAQQVWLFIGDRNCIHEPEDIIEVLA